MAELMRIAIGEISDRNLRHFRMCGKLRREPKPTPSRTHTTVVLL